MIEPPPIPLERGRLAPYRSEHDERTVEWLNTPEIQVTFGFASQLTTASHRVWVESASDTIIWAVLDEVGKHCGNVLLRVTERNRAGYFQIYLGVRSTRGKGLGRQVLDAVLRHAFDVLRLHRIYLHTLPGNLAAEKLYRAAGFTMEGVERDALLRDGAFVSQKRWSLLEQEWRAAASPGTS